MQNVRVPSSLLILPLLLAAACGGGSNGPTLSGSCRYECLNQVRRRFEQCTSPAGTACQSQMDPGSTLTNSCFADGHQLRWGQGGQIPSIYAAAYKDGARCA